jgi:membrane-bound inhibitor of C-type lysozyme
MTTPRRLFTYILVLIILIGAGVFAYTHFMPAKLSVVQTQPIATATFSCDAGKTITASFYEGTSTPAVGDQPPVPGGTVDLVLSDGRSMTLKQTISADGARYANMNETFVFWNKGDGAIVQENGADSAFTNCVTGATTTNVTTVTTATTTAQGFTEKYSNSSFGYAIQYPAGYTMNDKYVYSQLGPGKNISGTKFTVPGSFSLHTNLSADTYISVEHLPKVTSCTAAAFLAPGATVRNVTENGKAYSSATVSGAAAGNRYDETVYALTGSNPCVAVRYFVHYTAIENYPAGTVKVFNRDALTAQFDAIRNTLVLTQ